MKKSVCWLLALTTLWAFSGCRQSEDGGQVCVYMPDGAPALAMASLMEKDQPSDDVEYFVVNPALIKTKVTAKDERENADFCVLPLTAGSKLLGSGERYQLLATVTSGNLYFIAKNGLQITADTLSDLVGKTVGVLQLKEVPGLTLKTVLARAGIAWQELTAGAQPSAEKVNLKGMTSAGDMASLNADCYLLAEPAVSAMLSKGYALAGDLQALYGENGFPQAVLVGKRSFISENISFTRAFLQSVQESCNALLQMDGARLVQCVQAHLEDESYASSLKAGLLSTQTLARCGVRFDGDPKTRVLDYLRLVQGVDANAVALPSDDFFG